MGQGIKAMKLSILLGLTLFSLAGCQPPSTMPIDALVLVSGNLEIAAGSASALEIKLTPGDESLPNVDYALGATTSNQKITVSFQPATIQFNKTAQVSVSTAAGLASGSYQVNLKAQQGTSSYNLPLTISVK